MAQRKGSKAVKRTGVAITRTEFTAVPLREMNLLWGDRRVSGDGVKPGTPRLIEIILEGNGIRGDSWTCGLELQYANPELIYVRPRSAKGLSQEALYAFPPKEAADLEVVHVPPLSGIERDEPRRDRGMQDLLTGQGRPGEILRNLLWEIAQKRNDAWQELAGRIRDLFQIELLEPLYSPAQPFIVCEYKESGRERPLDLANAGSGTLQVLLILAFLYARPATVILLDEPDAHQHVILQKQVYDLIRQVARERNGQVVVATHSEVVLDSTEPTRVICFLGDAPRPLLSESQRHQLREALKRVTTTELLLARDVGSVLYVEGESDERILGRWAEILGHASTRFFKRPFIHPLGGRNLREAGQHFFAMQAAYPNIRGLVLLDGDNRDEPDEETKKSGLLVLRWRRYEIENYLLVPQAIKRFVNFRLLEDKIDAAFWKQVPKGTDLFSDHVSLVRLEASEEFILPLLRDIYKPCSRRDLYLLAAGMTPEEIHPEVIEKLDRMASVLNPPEG